MFYRTSNPVRDAERHQEELVSIPHVYCTICGKPLYVGDSAWHIDGEWWCEDCLKDAFWEEIADEDD